MAYMEHLSTKTYFKVYFGPIKKKINVRECENRWLNFNISVVILNLATKKR